MKVLLLTSRPVLARAIVGYNKHIALVKHVTKAERDLRKAGVTFIAENWPPKLGSKKKK